MKLPVGDGQVLHYEEHGNPNGVPAVILHGGPGSGSSPFHRTFFDLDRYRVIQYDQRGCGKSTPHASDPTVPLETNRLGNLLVDLDALRVACGVDAWVVFGISFGTMLGVAYAMTWPERVRALVVAGGAFGQPAELDWIYHGIGAQYPEAWARFSEGLPAQSRTAIVEAYRQKVNDPDPEVRAEFARRWTEWDWATASITPTPLAGKWADPAFQLARARICTHYFAVDLPAAGDQLTRPNHVARLNDCDGVIVNGEFDMPESAHALHALWPRAELVIVEAAGHSVGDAGTPGALRAATDRFA